MANNNKSGLSLNKISMWTVIAVAVLYLLSLIFNLIGANALVTIAGWLSAIATVVMICIVGILAWRYVRGKQFVWKLLYFICMLVVIVGVIIPLVV